MDPAVVVVIEKLSSPPHVRKTRLGHSGIVGNVGERILSDVAVKHIVFIVKVGNEYIEPSIVIIVTYRDAHTPLLGAISVDCEAGFESDLAKRAIPVVMVEIIRCRVVGDENIYAAVPIKVTGDDVQSVVADRVGNTGLLRDVGKRPVAVIMVERVTRSRQPPGTTLHRNALELACRALAERG